MKCYSVVELSHMSNAGRNTCAIVYTIMQQPDNVITETRNYVMAGFSVSARTIALLCCTHVRS